MDSIKAKEVIARIYIYIYTLHVYILFLSLSLPLGGYLYHHLFNLLLCLHRFLCRLGAALCLPQAQGAFFFFF